MERQESTPSRRVRGDRIRFLWVDMQRVRRKMFTAPGSRTVDPGELGRAWS